MEELLSRPVGELREFYPRGQVNRFYEFCFIEREEIIGGYLEKSYLPNEEGLFNIVEYPVDDGYNGMIVDQVYDHEILGIDRWNTVFVMENRGK